MILNRSQTKSFGDVYRNRQLETGACVCASTYVIARSAQKENSSSIENPHKPEC